MTIASASPPTVGDGIVRLLERLGVEVVFGIPGSHNLPLFSGLADSPIRLVSTRHEQGAGFAADGYARASGRPGVLVVTTGPGILNAATALATAHADSVPVLAISPGARLDDEGQELGWLHESKDQHASLNGLLTSIRCRTERHAYRAIVDAFSSWMLGRRRPVHIEVPIDLLAAPSVEPLPALPSIAPAAANEAALDEAARVLSAAVTPVIVAGGGAVDARDEVNEVARLLGAPLVTTRAAAGLRRAADALPTTVLPYAPEALSDADVLLVVGSELSRRDLPDELRPVLGTLVRIDVEPARLMAGREGDLHIVADAASALRALAARLGSAPAARPAERQQDYADAIARAYPGPLRSFHEALATVFGANVVITGDSSQVSYLGTGAHYPFQHPRSFLYPDAFAPLGYGLPAAIGAKLAAPQREVVALVGDGAFLFTVQELTTAVEQMLPILVLVVENGGFLEIEQEMSAFGMPPVGVRFAYPDLAQVAAAFGAASAHVRTLEEISRWHGRIVDGSITGPVVLVVSQDDLGAIVSPA
jgi:acetolactate synthase-1/2/3 large subunit